MPFEAWSLWMYGLYSASDGENGRQLLFPTTQEEAECLLQILDLTIAETEDAIIPRDIDTALNAILNFAPAAGQKRAFQRLKSTARR